MQLQQCEQVCSHQEKDLWIPDESQRCRELPSGATTVTVGNDVSVVVELQPLQQVVHQLQRKHAGDYKVDGQNNKQHT